MRAMNESATIAIQRHENLATVTLCNPERLNAMTRAMWRTLRTDGLIAELRYGTPQSAQGRERRQWAADLRCAIDALRSTTSASV